MVLELFVTFKAELHLSTICWATDALKHPLSCSHRYPCWGCQSVPASLKCCRIISMCHSVPAGTLDGAVGLILPVTEKTYRRLHMLQTKLVECIPHYAGLNPKAFRYTILSVEGKTCASDQQKMVFCFL